MVYLDMRKICKRGNISQLGKFYMEARLFTYYMCMGPFMVINRREVIFVRKKVYLLGEKWMSIMESIEKENNK